jgi:GntR family transcriptional regulator
MLIRVDPTSRQPLHEQIAAQVRGAAGRGEVQVGERLPTARELAAELEVNMHTVLRAYSQLQEDGIVSVRRGRGVTLCAPGGRAKLVELARALRDEARRQGVDDAELRALLEGTT